MTIAVCARESYFVFFVPFVVNLPLHVNPDEHVVAGMGADCYAEAAELVQGREIQPGEYAEQEIVGVDGGPAR